MAILDQRTPEGGANGEVRKDSVKLTTVLTTHVKARCWGERELVKLERCTGPRLALGLNSRVTHPSTLQVGSVDTKCLPTRATQLLLCEQSPLWCPREAGCVRLAVGSSLKRLRMRCKRTVPGLWSAPSGHRVYSGHELIIHSLEFAPLEPSSSCIQEKLGLG